MKCRSVLLSSQIAFQTRRERIFHAIMILNITCHINPVRQMKSSANTRTGIIKCTCDGEKWNVMYKKFHLCEWRGSQPYTPIHNIIVSQTFFGRFLFRSPFFGFFYSWTWNVIKYNLKIDFHASDMKTFFLFPFSLLRSLCFRQGAFYFLRPFFLSISTFYQSFFSVCCRGCFFSTPTPHVFWRKLSIILKIRYVYRLEENFVVAFWFVLVSVKCLSIIFVCGKRKSIKFFLIKKLHGNDD